MKKRNLVYILILVNVICKGYSQSEHQPSKTLFLVGEFNLGVIINNSQEPNNFPLDVGINIGFDKKLTAKSGLGLHLFINANQKIGLRARASQYTKERKKFDISFGVAINSFKSYLDVEFNYCLNEDIAIYSRLDFYGFRNDQQYPRRTLNLGLKLKAPKLIAITAGATAILLGIISLQGIANSN